MIWELNLFLLVCSVVAACFALHVRDLLASVILLSAFSFFMCLLWAEMGAVDVAFTEAAVGVCISTIFFVLAIFHSRRRQKD